MFNLNKYCRTLKFALTRRPEYLELKLKKQNEYFILLWSTVMKTTSEAMFLLSSVTDTLSWYTPFVNPVTLVLLALTFANWTFDGPLTFSHLNDTILLSSWLLVASTTTQVCGKLMVVLSPAIATGGLFVGGFTKTCTSALLLWFALSVTCVNKRSERLCNGNGRSWNAYAMHVTTWFNSFTSRPKKDVFEFFRPGKMYQLCRNPRLLGAHSNT